MRIAHGHRWLLCGAVALAAAIPNLGEAGQFVRALDPEAQRILDHAIDGSPTVARMVQELEHDELVVMVETAPLSARFDGNLVLLGSAHQWRFLLIRLEPGGPEPEMGGRLGHELQHALEVASHAEVRDQAGMAQLFSHIGVGPIGGPYETYAAKEVGKEVRRELGGL
jgi:hypothetical protein